MNRMSAAKKRSGGGPVGKGSKKSISKKQPSRASAKGSVPAKRKEGELARKNPSYKAAYVKRGQSKRKKMNPNNPRY